MAERRKAEHERQRMLNHEQAALNAYAYHSPKKMPQYKPPKKGGGPIDQEVALAHARGYFKALARKSRGAVG